MRHFAAMLSAVLLVSGVLVTAYGSWRGYAAARAALAPLRRDGEPTLTAVDDTRPVRDRVRVRLAARQAILAVAWLALAMYGMYLATVGLEVRA